MIRLEYIKGYGKRYLISDEGDVMSLPRTLWNGAGHHVSKMKHMKTHVGTNGYVVVGLTKNGVTKVEYLHKLLAQAFLPNPKKKKCINHKNGIKDDNSLENIEWCTYSENAKHALKNGLRKITPMPGEKNHQAKLTEKKVKELLQSKGIAKVTDLAKKYKISVSQVYSILDGRTWKHLRK